MQNQIEQNAIIVPDKKTARAVLANVAVGHTTTIKLNDFHLSTRLIENEKYTRLYQCFVGFDDKNAESMNTHEKLMNRIDEILNSIENLSNRK